MESPVVHFQNMVFCLKCKITEDIRKSGKEEIEQMVTRS